MNRLRAFLLGMYEFRNSLTWADPNRDAESGMTALDEAYDRGRDLAHALTFRRYDS